MTQLPRAPSKVSRSRPGERLDEPAETEEGNGGPLFANRVEAGRVLATRLTAYQGREDVLVLALPRGGVPVAYEVAQALGGAPLDVILVRKLGVPGNVEFAMGAIVSGGVPVLNEKIVRGMHIAHEAIARAVRREEAELHRQERVFRDDRPFLPPAGRTILLIDDGLATGATMRAAVQALCAMRPAKLVVAVPVASPEACRAFRDEVDEIICLRTPDPFLAVGHWYEDFSPTTDGEVRDLLRTAWANAPTTD